MAQRDEINIALRDEKPPMTHVVLTGRNAKPELIEIADLVTEMELIKHPFRSGVKAQAFGSERTAMTSVYKEDVIWEAMVPMGFL